MSRRCKRPILPGEVRRVRAVLVEVVEVVLLPTAVVRFLGQKGIEVKVNCVEFEAFKSTEILFTRLRVVTTRKRVNKISVLLNALNSTQLIRFLYYARNLIISGAK